MKLSIQIGASCSVGMKSRKYHGAKKKWDEFILTGTLRGRGHEGKSLRSKVHWFPTQLYQVGLLSGRTELV